MISQLRQAPISHATRAIRTRTPPKPSAPDWGQGCKKCFKNQKLRVGGGLFAGATVAGGLGYLMYKEHQANKIFQEIVARSHDLSRIKNADCVVWFEAYNDHNGALAIGRPNRTLAHLSQQGITPIFRRVHKTREIFEALHALQQQKNRIHVLVLAAHGSADGMVFDDKLRIPSAGNPLDWTSQWPAAIRKLDAGTQVIFISCKAADETNGGSFARQVSAFNPQIIVSAPADNTYFETIQFILTRTGNNRLSVRADARFQTGSARDVTAVFQNGQCIQKPPEYCIDPMINYLSQKIQEYVSGKAALNKG